jgi:flavin reductase (DIM6/NTAB) family NADH-FMN oxidoreductase RutF
MPTKASSNLVALDTGRPIWDRVFTVAPLVIVGSKEANGEFNLAPKHMAMPLGLGNYFAFVCNPRHTTYHNIQRHGVFTVSYPRVSEVVTTSLAAAPRCDDQSKPSLMVLPTFAARKVEGALVKDCYLFLECTLHSVMDGFDGYSLIVGKVVAAAADEEALRKQELDESEQLFHFPLLAYLHPGRITEIKQSTTFPFPKGFSR